MSAPWADGPKELLQHAVDHLALGGDFDRRIAMISIDNAVELMIKTFLGLPKRAQGGLGPSRKELESAKESFPALLDLLEASAPEKLIGLDLSDVEWYHRIRNELYHSGNGITVERTKVETYYQLAVALFENLFGAPPQLSHTSSIRTKVGEFLEVWNLLEKTLRCRLPPKDGLAYHWKRDWLRELGQRAEELYSQAAMFRNVLVHGMGEVQASDLDENRRRIEEVMSLLQKAPVNEHRNGQ